MRLWRIYQSATVENTAIMNKLTWLVNTTSFHQSFSSQIFQFVAIRTLSKHVLHWTRSLNSNLIFLLYAIDPEVSLWRYAAYRILHNPYQNMRLTPVTVNMMFGLYLFNWHKCGWNWQNHTEFHWVLFISKNKSHLLVMTLVLRNIFYGTYYSSWEKK